MDLLSSAVVKGAMQNFSLSTIAITLAAANAWAVPLGLELGLLSPLGAAILILFLSLVGIPYWSLIHEGIHGHLLPGRRGNLVLAQVMSFFFGFSFSFVQLAHLGHHQMNRSPQEVPELQRESTPQRAQMRYFLTLLFGTFLFEVLAPLKFLFLKTARLKKFIAKIYPQESYLRKVHDRALVKKRAIAREAVYVMLFWGLTLFLYRHFLGHFLLFFFTRAFFISFFDNVYHYDTPLHATDSAKNLGLPKFLSAYFLNFNYHHVHHLYPSLKWPQLPHYLEQSSPPLPFLPALWAQFSGILFWDQETTQESAHVKKSY